MAPLKQTSPLLTLPLLTLSGVAAAQTNPSQPNVILILADDMGYGGVHCYGGDGIPSPAIDRLAEEGIVCTNFHTNAPVSSPTRVSIMTGCYQQRAGLNHIYSETDPMDGLDPDQFP
ncbi:MAG: sulfatase-like hydrolase/transferase, partial [Tidjanibacter sp.]|nr:sulfatase-like hydrolase/transferase [Tidjanibacter sp.]